MGKFCIRNDTLSFIYLVCCELSFEFLLVFFRGESLFMKKSYFQSHRRAVMISTPSFAALKKVREFYTTLIHFACSVITVIIILRLLYVFGQCLQNTIS